MWHEGRSSDSEGTQSCIPALLWLSPAARSWVRHLTSEPTSTSATQSTKHHVRGCCEEHMSHRVLRCFRHSDQPPGASATSGRLALPSRRLRPLCCPCGLHMAFHRSQMNRCSLEMKARERITTSCYQGGKIRWQSVPQWFLPLALSFNNTHCHDVVNV